MIHLKRLGMGLLQILVLGIFATLIVKYPIILGSILIVTAFLLFVYVLGALFLEAWFGI
jgi:hypothetical protein